MSSTARLGSFYPTRTCSRAQALDTPPRASGRSGAQKTQADQSIREKRAALRGPGLLGPPGAGLAPLTATSSSPAGLGQSPVLYPTVPRRPHFWPSSLRLTGAHFPSLTFRSSSRFGERSGLPCRNRKRPGKLRDTAKSRFYLGMGIRFKTNKSAYPAVETVKEFTLPAHLSNSCQTLPRLVSIHRP